MGLGNGVGGVGGGFNVIEEEKWQVICSYLYKTPSHQSADLR